MQRINTANKAVDLFGAGKHGFSPGNSGLGILATANSADFMNAVQEELLKFIESAGLTPDNANNNQVYSAVQLMIAAATGQDFKASARAATTANIANLAGGTPSVLDGVALALNDRILVKDQATASQNGLYYVTTLGTGANGTWTRTADSDQTGELTPGAIVAVEEGTLSADSEWMVTTDGAITIGTTSIAFTRFGATNASKSASVGASVAASALTVTIAAETLDFRSATLTSGTSVTRTAGAGSLTVPSGATLGSVNGQLTRLVWGWLDNAGTLELVIANVAGGLNFDETTLISTTAISGAANSASVYYSATARANVAFRVRGFCDITEAAAGTWATAATFVQAIGGQSGLALTGVGYGQTRQNLTGSRAYAVTYYNLTGKERDVDVTYSGGGQYGFSFYINGTVIATYGTNGGGWIGHKVQHGESYKADATAGVLTSWFEKG